MTTLLNTMITLSLAATLLLTLAALLTTTLLRHTSAATRHLTWTATCLCLLCLPLFALLPTPQNLPPALTPLPRLPVLPYFPTSPLPASLSLSLPTPPAPHRPISSYLPLLYPLGLLASLTPLLLSPLLLSRLKRRSTPATHPTLLSTLHDCQRALNLPHPIPLLLSNSPTTMPLTFGLLRPHILLPSSSPTWPPSQLRQVLSHELAHIQRLDCLTLYLAQLARALHWFNPLAHFAVSRMLAERERACDDLVLRATAALPSDYADTLLHLTASLRPAPRLIPAMPMSRPSHLHTRLLAILDPHRNRSPLTRRLTIAVLLLTPLLALPLACTPNPKSTAPTAAADDAKYGWTPETNAAAQNLKWIGQAILLYSNEHKNALPPTLGDSLASLDGPPAQNALHFLDPRDHLTVPANPTPEWINKHTPYIYLGRPDLLLSDLPNPDDAAATTILVHEDLARPHTVPNHPPLIVALYNDGHGELLPLDDARKQIESSKQTITTASKKPAAVLPGPPNEPAWMTEAYACQRNIRNVGQGVYVYAAEHANHLPPDLGTAFPYIDRYGQMSKTDHAHATPLERVRFYFCPLTANQIQIPDNPTPAWLNQHTTYTYLGSNDVDITKIPDAQWTTTILLHDGPTPHHHSPKFGDLLICCFLDGHSEALTLPDALKSIATSKQTLATAAAANQPPRAQSTKAPHENAGSPSPQATTRPTPNSNWVGSSDITATVKIPRPVSFDLGDSSFLPGDSITILKVLDLTPPKTDLTLARTLQVTGTYTLASHPDARLGAEITSNDPLSGKGAYTPISAGTNQPFSLTFTLAGNGNPHVSFYPAHQHAQSFGGIYFGSGPTLLKHQP